MPQAATVGGWTHLHVAVHPYPDGTIKARVKRRRGKDSFRMFLETPRLREVEWLTEGRPALQAVAARMGWEYEEFEVLK